MIPSRALLKLILQAVVKHLVSGSFSGPLYNVYVGLIVGTPALSENTVQGDITEPTYSGYARLQVAAWDGPFEAQDGSVYLDGADLNFTMADGLVPTNVTGYFLNDAVTAGNYLGGELFPTPYNLVNPDQAVSVSPECRLPDNVDLGSFVQL